MMELLVFFSDGTHFIGLLVFMYVFAIMMEHIISAWRRK